MSHYPRSQSGSYVKEKEVLEPEGSCEERIVKRTRSGRQIEETNLSLRKCHSVDESLKRPKRRRVRRLKTRNLKVPQVPEKIVNIVNILQHENFLDMFDRFFKLAASKQPRKKAHSKKPSMIRNPDCKRGLPVSVDFDRNVS